MDIADAASAGDVVMILLPDERQADIWEGEIKDGIAEGNLLMFAHGFAIHFGQIDPPPGEFADRISGVLRPWASDPRE